jgi:hypothetical protein
MQGNCSKKAIRSYLLWNCFFKKQVNIKIEQKEFPVSKNKGAYQNDMPHSSGCGLVFLIKVKDLMTRWQYSFYSW